jgi:hypothetical protein
MASRSARLLLALAAVVFVAAPAARAQCPATVPVEGAPPPGPLPLLPADNWWNLDVSSAPVDPGSAAFIAFVNNGGTRTLHPDFGGEASPGSTTIYGFPWAVVDATQPKQTVSFQYASESDGAGVPYYPIPAQAITQPHWVEGGAPGNVDQRSQDDRHLLMIDCTNRYLYELYSVWYDGTRWQAGSGAFFDLNTNDRRPEGWTSADAAGLAIFPGLVRYDEAWNTAVTDIGHAFRVTVRATNGHVWPASHSAGSTAGALPLGARLRLKATVNGADPALRTSDPNVRKIFRAMQRHGLIVADNGSDLFVSGTFDTRWDNSILNPAFALLSANDFEVVQLGWNPATAPAPAPAAVASLAVSPASVVGGSGATATVTLTAAAPAGGAAVALSSAGSAVAVPAGVTVPAGATSATFPVTTSAVTLTVSATISATYGGATASAILTVTAAPAPAPAPAAALASLALSPTTVVGGATVTGTVTLTAAAPAGGAVIALGSSRPAVVPVPATVTVPAGATSARFTVTTVRPSRKRIVTVSASYAGVTRSATVTVTRY